ATASASVESASAVAPRRRRVDGSARARLRTALLRRQARHPLQGAAHLLLPQLHLRPRVRERRPDPRDPRPAALAALRPLLAPDRGRRRADEPLGAAVERVALELERGLGRTGRRLVGPSCAAFPPRRMAEPGAPGGLVWHRRSDSPDLAHVPAHPGRASGSSPPLDERRRASLSVALRLQHFAGAGAESLDGP